MKQRAGGMIGTVDLHMTVLAAAIHQPRVRADTGRQVGRRQQIIRMSAIDVALLAQKRPACGEQGFMIGAMRRMTVQTVFPDRCMLPQHGAAFFLMTIETKLIDRQITEQRSSDGAMRIMTIGTVQLALDQGHV